jgi:replicative DNA helicase
MSNTLIHALEYAGRGLRVIPIAPGEKFPKGIKGWESLGTTDLDQIRAWWTGPHAGWGVGILGGRTRSGKQIFILDLDEHSPEASGADTLADLETEHGPLPDTVTVHTPSGGRHLYFYSPVEIRNDAGKRLGPGLDIRGEGGMCLAPPTTHPDGGNYLADLEHGFDRAPAEAPEWLINLLTYTPERVDSQKPDIFLTGDRPSDQYNATHNLADLLTADGWTYSHSDPTGASYWRRPGKQRGSISASLDAVNPGILNVFSTNAPIPTGGYSAYGYTAATRHHGDWKALSDALKTANKTNLTAPPAPAPGETWPDPLPIAEKHPTPPFPTETLPAWILNHVEQTAHNIQTGIDLPAQLAIAALSVAALGPTRIQYRGDWQESLSLYMAIACPPSTGKSPALHAMFNIIRTIETERKQQAQHAQHLHESHKKILDKQRAEAENRAAKDPNTALLELGHIIDQITQLSPPPSGEILIDDSTPERTGLTLHQTGGYAAIVSAEGGIFNQMQGVYNPNAANLNMYLELWSPRPYRVDRLSRASIDIKEANLAIICTVQPEVLDEIAANPTLTRRGLIQRFLLTEPDIPIGQRNRINHTTHTNPAHRNTYETTITHIANTLHHQPITLTLDGPAADHYAQWDQTLENSLQHDPDHSRAEWIGKLRATTLRLAGILHLAWHPHNTPTHISEQTIQHTLTLARYYQAHIDALRHRWGADQVNIIATRIIELAVKNGKTEFTGREAMRFNSRLINSMDELIEPIRRLIERDWIRPVDGDEIVINPGRGKTGTKFRINPKGVEKVQTSGRLSRMSRMSPKGHIEDLSSSHQNALEKNTPPHDMRDMRDNSPQTTPTNPDDLDW